MTRLIDADALEALCSTPGLIHVAMIVKQQPTIDAVQVIRCLDCKNYAGSGMYCGWNMIAKPDGHCHHANEEPVYADD